MKKKLKLTISLLITFLFFLPSYSFGSDISQYNNHIAKSKRKKYKKTKSKVKNFWSKKKKKRLKKIIPGVKVNTYVGRSKLRRNQNISIYNNKLDRKYVSIARGYNVKWTNYDSTPKTLILKSSGLIKRFFSKKKEIILKPNKTYSKKFISRSKYTYYIKENPSISGSIYVKKK